MRAFAAILALCGMALPAVAQDVDRGRQVYRSYCATCHGMNGGGDGPMTAVMAIQPPDLTRLAALNGGVFPRVRVVYRVDGRDALLAHGGPMPMFGPLFDGRSAALDAADGTPILTSEPLADVVVYLESIQRE